MISVVLPYWNRSAATNRAMHLYEKHYSDLELEVIVVDDGSREEFKPEKDWPFIRIHKLTRKDVAKNPCVPINVGVGLSRGEIIVLSNPEILHEAPVLQEMKKELESIGEMGYVSAACMYDREQKWHAHSHLVADGQRDNYPQPRQSAFHFCTMFYRSLWDKAGGFDEDYREGTGWDDPDWVNRVHRAGGIFRIRDDLVVIHTRDGAETQWPESRDRNRDLFFRKWPRH